MKKIYDSPEFELTRISFESILEQGVVISIDEDHKHDGDDDQSLLE